MRTKQKDPSKISQNKREIVLPEPLPNLISFSSSIGSTLSQCDKIPLECTKNSATPPKQQLRARRGRPSNSSRRRVKNAKATSCQPTEASFPSQIHIESAANLPSVSYPTPAPSPPPTGNDIQILPTSSNTDSQFLSAHNPLLSESLKLHASLLFLLYYHGFQTASLSTSSNLSNAGIQAVATVGHQATQQTVELHSAAVQATKQSFSRSTQTLTTEDSLSHDLAPAHFIMKRSPTIRSSLITSNLIPSFSLLPTSQVQQATSLLLHPKSTQSSVEDVKTQPRRLLFPTPPAQRARYSSTEQVSE